VTKDTVPIVRIGGGNEFPAAEWHDSGRIIQSAETPHHSIQPRDESGQFRKITTKDLREAREQIPEESNVDTDNVGRTASGLPVGGSSNVSPTESRFAESTVAAPDSNTNLIRAIDRSVFQDRVPQPVQRDGQRLIDAIESGDAETLQGLFDKYQRHALQMQGGGGAGPGKVFRPDPAKATIGNVADIALRRIREVSPARPQIPEEVDATPDSGTVQEAAPSSSGMETAAIPLRETSEGAVRNVGTSAESRGRLGSGESATTTLGVGTRSSTAPAAPEERKVANVNASSFSSTR
jgi:hypothetical protein